MSTPIAPTDTALAKASRYRCASVLDQLPELIVRIDRDLRLRYLNPTAQGFSGVDIAQLIGRFVGELDVAVTGGVAGVTEAVGSVFATGDARAVRFRLGRQDNARFFEGSIVPELDSTGEFETVLVIGHDVTDRLNLERDLAATESQLKLVTESTHDRYWELDAEFRFSRYAFAGQAAQPDWALSVIGRAPWELPLVGVSEALWAEYRALLERHEPFGGFEVGCRTQEGMLLWFRASGVPMFGRAAEFLGYRGVSRNITGSKLLEAELMTAKR